MSSAVRSGMRCCEKICTTSAISSTNTLLFSRHDLRHKQLHDIFHGTLLDAFLREALHHFDDILDLRREQVRDLFHGPSPFQQSGPGLRGTSTISPRVRQMRSCGINWTTAAVCATSAITSTGCGKACLRRRGRLLSATSSAPSMISSASCGTRAAHHFNKLLLDLRLGGLCPTEPRCAPVVPT